MNALLAAVARVACGMISNARASNFVHALKAEGVNNMRIICDRCDRKYQGSQVRQEL